MNKLIFLGTGSAAHLTRQLTSLCFVANEKAFLIDCGDGMGTMRNLVQAGISVEQVNDVFLTHKHADHIAGVPHYLFLKMLEREQHVHVYGPKQAVAAARTTSFLTHSLTVKCQDRIDFHPIRSGESIQFSGAQVVGTTVKHVPGYISFAYAITIGKTKVVFTGDMRPNNNFYTLAKDADILIHECFGLAKNEAVIHAGHSTAKDAGEAAARAGVRELILTHLPTRDFDIDPTLLAEEAKKYFSREVIIAEDLMEVNL